jgi:hypothetical protein
MGKRNKRQGAKDAPKGASSEPPERSAVQKRKSESSQSLFEKRKGVIIPAVFFDRRGRP